MNGFLREKTTSLLPTSVWELIIIMVHLSRDQGKGRGTRGKGESEICFFLNLFFLSFFFFQVIYIGILYYYISHKNWNSDFFLLIINSNYTYNYIRRTKKPLYDDGILSLVAWIDQYQTQDLEYLLTCL